MWNAGKTGVKNNGEDIYDTASWLFPRGCFPHENPPEHHFLHLTLARSSTVTPSENAQGVFSVPDFLLSRSSVHSYVANPAASCHLVLQPTCLCLMASLHLSTTLMLFLLAAAQEKVKHARGDYRCSLVLRWHSLRVISVPFGWNNSSLSDGIEIHSLGLLLSNLLKASTHTRKECVCARACMHIYTRMCIFLNAWSKA